MARHVNVLVYGESVEGQELEFEPLREAWNEYRCEDGSYVKLKVVVSRIIKLEKQSADGEPVYRIISTNVVAAWPGVRPDP